ncbi:Replication protein [Xenorhabdus nematophila]|uniref:Replication protein n=1 Tax=Xenorhabdus nematophila TaxID=628 RepID=UPI0032B7961F
MKRHNWHRNSDLIKLRQRGYIPYTQRNNPNFEPKPLRISARSESCEALTVISMVLAANADYNPDSEYLFEVMLPLEKIAEYMGMLHVYDNGRKAYDSPRNALDVTEQLEYTVVQRGRDTDTGQNKPLRIWLTPKFFTSRGIAVDEIRNWLKAFKRWALKKGLTETLKDKYESHMLRMARIGIETNNKHSLHHKLKKIKRYVVSERLLDEKQSVVRELEDQLNKVDKEIESERLDVILENTPRLFASFAKKKNKKQSSYKQTYFQWSNNLLPHEALVMDKTFKAKYPELYAKDEEAYYKLLLESVGVI